MLLPTLILAWIRGAASEHHISADNNEDQAILAGTHTIAYGLGSYCDG